MQTKSRRWTWVGSGAVLWAVAAAGQYVTPVRVSWTEDPGTTATITWDTAAAARGTVRYGLTTNYTETVHDGGGVHRHVVTLRNLQPGTRYFYEAAATDGYRQTASFRTAPAADAPLHFVLHGDLQGGLSNVWAQAVADRITAEDPHWVQQLGDLSDEAYSGAGFGTWAAFFQICSQELAQAVFLPIPGNHDDPDNATDPDPARGLYHRLFTLPEPSLGLGFYAYTAGRIRFIGLSTEETAPVQTNWLAGELQAAANDTNITWVVPILHRPPYSQGEREGWLEGKTNWCPLFVKYEADLVLSGHSHNYQRTIPIRGVRYLVTGGAGAHLYDSTPDEPMLAFTTTCYHHVSCQVTGTTWQVRAIRSDGLVFDTETITHRRAVRVAPAFPLRGQSATISYRAEGGPLAAANPVYIHLGQDAFTNAFADAAMTWNAAENAWVYGFTVPAAATQRLAFVFHDPAGTNWDNHYAHDWQALLGRVETAPAALTAGSNATFRYDAALGPLAAATQVWARFSCAGAGGYFDATGRVALAQPAPGARWETTLAVPAQARTLSVVFSGAPGGLDDNDRRGWTFPVAGATHAAWPPAPVAAWGSPVLTGNPTDAPPNNVGDNFDLVMTGPPLQGLNTDLGFGNWGRVWVNADATNLYLGGFGLDAGGTNNVLILFLGVDSLTDNAWNLWHKTGLPNALDLLHNVRFTEPLDVALVLGNQFGDGPAYTNFTYGGYDFGQGVYYLGTNTGGFVPMAGAQVSQFDGDGTTPCATGGDGTRPETTRWEVALPWSALGAAGPAGVSNLFLGGVIASHSISGNDRYLSQSYLGDRIWGGRDAYGQFAYHSVNLRPARVNLLHADLLGDGLSNGWRQAWFGTPAGPPAGEDTDGDGQSNGQEEVGGTHPGDRNSFFFQSAPAPAGAPFRLEWSFAPGRFYDVERTPNLLDPFVPFVTGLATNRYEPVTNGYYRVRARR